MYPEVQNLYIKAKTIISKKQLFNVKKIFKNISKYYILFE